MGIFAKLSTDGIKKTEDNVGGGGYLRETDINIFEVKAFYAGKSDGGAMSVTGVFVDESGKEYTETFYVTNRQGENFYHVKDGKGEKTKEKSFLPGFNIVNDICMITTDKPLDEQDDEEKVVKVYDYDAKAQVPKSVPMLMGVVGQKVALAIYKNVENKTKKDGNGDYQPIAEERETNTIEKAFFPVFRTTVRETEVAIENGGAVNNDDKVVDAQGNDVAVFWDAWIEKHKGKIKDKRKIKDGSAGTSGKPGGKLGGPPASGANPNAGTERKSLFNKG